MYQLLRRKSLKISEYNVFKIAKAYLISTTESMGIFDTEGRSIPKFLKDAVNFEKINLKNMESILDDPWLPKGTHVNKPKMAYSCNETSY